MNSLTVISGGQTGADQGGLLGAQDAGIPTGGWAPYKFLTEKGSDYTLQRFGLKDSFKGYAERTRMNVHDSDITLWFGNINSAGGGATKRACIQECKPIILATNMAAYQIASMIQTSHATIINIAGNRESSLPGLQEFTRKTVREALIFYKEKLS